MSALLGTRPARGLCPGHDLVWSLREEMDNLLSRFSADIAGDWPTAVVALPIDIAETETTITVRMDMPGVNPDDIKIDIAGNVLRVSALKWDQEEQDQSFHRKERRAGRLYRAVTLPCHIEDEMGDPEYAEYVDGVLTIVLPKPERAKSRQIKVKVKNR